MALQIVDGGLFGGESVAKGDEFLAFQRKEIGYTIVERLGGSFNLLDGRFERGQRGSGVNGEVDSSSLVAGRFLGSGVAYRSGIGRKGQRRHD